MRKTRLIFSFVILFALAFTVKQFLFAAESEDVVIHKTGTYDEGLYSRILLNITSGSLGTPVVTGETIEELKAKCLEVGGKEINSDTLQVKCENYNIFGSRVYTIPKFLRFKMKTPSETVSCKASHFVNEDLSDQKIESCLDLMSIPMGKIITSYITTKLNNCLLAAFKSMLPLSEIKLINAASVPASCEFIKKTEVIDGYDCPTSYKKIGYTALCESNFSSTQKLTNHPIRGNMYKTEEKDGSSNSAYCIQPGKKYKDNQTHYLDTNFDISNCSASNSTFECGLASILSKANKEGYSYATTLTALRLWTAYKSAEAGDGWWEKSGDQVLTSSEKLYTKTANAIMNNGYTGIGKTDERALIYGLGSSGEKVVTESFDLFKECANGALPAISSGVYTNDSSVDFSKGTDTVVIYSKTPVESVSASNGVTASVGKSVNMGTYYAVTINLKGNCKVKEFNLSVKTNGDTASIKRYRPKGGSSYQVMMVYDESGDGEVLSFKNICGGGTACKSKLEVIVDIPEDCEMEGSTGTIKDPAMDDILDPCRSAAEKEVYDTKTSYISTNQNKYCTLYCREEANTVFMDITDGLAGRHFKYDLLGKIAAGIPTSTIVEGKKECVSVVKHSNWETDFEKAQDNVLSTWTDMKKWEALVAAGSTQKTTNPPKVSCSDCCVALVPSPSCAGDPTILDCPEVCPAGGTETTSASCPSYISYYWKSGSCRYCSRTGCGTKSCSADSSGGINSSCDACGGGASCSSYDGNPGYAADQYSAAVSAYTSALKVREQLYVDIQNCNLYNTIDVVDSTAGANLTVVQTKIIDSYADEYKSTIKDIKYADKEYGNTVKVNSKVGVTNTYYEPTSWCKGCTKTADLSNNTTKTLKYYKCSTTGCNTVNINVPINTWARIQTSMEADYYQDRKYFVQAYTGKVAKDSAPPTNYEALDEYIYPVSLLTRAGTYPITVDYSDIVERFKRNGKSTVVGVSGDLYTCYYDIENKMIDYHGGLGFIFRQIDLGKIFGSDRKKGENWASEGAVINEIQNLGNDIWTKKTPEYSFTLTPDNRKSIKEYNLEKARSAVGYTDMSLRCKKGNIKCESTFLDGSNINRYAKEYELGGRLNWR